MENDDKIALKELFDRGDWEGFHEIYDRIMEAELRKFAPDFVKEMEDIAADATFWYS